MSRQHARLFGFIVAVALTVGACSASSLQLEPTQPLPVAPTERPTSTVTPEPHFDGVIRIGAALSATGKYVREGKDVRQGYDFCVDWVNDKRGGVRVGDKRYKVEMVYYDDESKPANATDLIEKLITEDKVDFLLGPYSSEITATASAVAEQHGMIMVEGNGASESLFANGYQNLFAVLTPAGNYTQSALKALADKGAMTVVIAYEDTAFPKSVADGAQRWALEYGMPVLAVETYPEGATDLSPIMARFRDLKPDVFVGGGHFNDALLFVKSAKALDFAPKAMVITVGPSNPDFANELGADAEYLLGPSQWEPTMSWQDQWFRSAKDYATQYNEKWKEPPTYQAAQSTAAAQALVEAIEQAGSLKMDDVRQALRTLDIMTFYGPIKFDETGKNVGKPMGTIQIQNGEIFAVAPSEAAVRELIYPMPGWEGR
ncbi:MAG: amino acid ABC transporter substrate-binding protein [Chloroflexi bacterium]|nr:amino acid ABC transporter substrate-binding protein [Chloroflexota bacterium]